MKNFTKTLCFLFFLLVFSCRDKERHGFSERKVAQEQLLKIDAAHTEGALDSLVEEIAHTSNDSLLRQYQLKIADKYYGLNALNKSLKTSRKVYHLGLVAHDSLAMAKALYYMGDCYEKTRRDSSYYYYLQAEKIYRQLNDIENWGRMHFFKAYILFYEGSYTEAEIELTKSLTLLHRTDNHKLIYSAYNLLANALEGQNNFSEALKYHQLALAEITKLHEKGHDPQETVNFELNTLNNLGHLHIRTENYQQAMPLLKKVLASEGIKNNDPYLYSTALNNLSYAKMKLRDYTNLPAQLYESLRIREKLNSKSGIVSSKIRLGEFYLMRNDSARAISFFNESYALAYEIKSHHDILYSLNLLAKTDLRNSAYHSSKYIRLSDSIARLERAIQNKYARISYETEKLEAEKKQLVKRNLKIAVTFVLFILLLVVLLIISSLRAKNKEMMYVQQQQRANEEIYLLLKEQQEKITRAREQEKDRIAMELHDGIMNRIYGVRMNLGFFNSKTDDLSIEKRKEYILELQNIEKEIRVISHDLKGETLLKERDYPDMIQFLLQTQENVTATRFEWQMDKNINWDAVSNTLKITIYRIIQEAVLNVIKYAEAESCIVSLLVVEKKLKLIISDDGRGFDTGAPLKGIGLKNMADRAASEKGSFTYGSVFGKGTRFVFLFPYQERALLKLLK